MIRKAKAVWRGTGRAGNGHVSTALGVAMTRKKRVSAITCIFAVVRACARYGVLGLSSQNLTFGR